MQAAHCPVCHEFVGHVPDGWLVHIEHRPFAHTLVTERPPEDDPNPD